MILQISYWIAGVVLAVVWFSRILEAAIGMPRIANVARPEWDRKLDRLELLLDSSSEPRKT